VSEGKRELAKSGKADFAPAVLEEMIPWLSSIS
jgi:hypothetical protein